MDRQTLEKEVLVSGFEDSTGLWEVIWYLNTASPEMPEDHKVKMARSVLKDLLRERSIELYYVDEASRREEKLPTTDATEVLAHDANWATPDVVGKEYRYINTKRGDRALRKMWAEAQS